MELNLDDRAQYYVGTGLTSAKDAKTCLRCGATILIFDMRCEGCGSTGKPDPPPTWTCTNCGINDHETEQDAERCCYPMHVSNDSYTTLCGIPTNNAYWEPDRKSMLEDPDPCESCDELSSKTQD